MYIFFVRKDCGVCMCVCVSQKFHHLMEIHGCVPNSLYIQTGGQTSGIHMNLRLL